MSEARKKFTIDATPEEVYAVLTDLEAYPSIFSDCTGVLVLDKEDDSWVMEQTVKIIKEFTYTLALKGVPNRSLEWKQVEGPFKTDEGGWYLTELPDGRTEVEYRIKMEFGIPVPRSILSTILEKNLPSMFEELKTEVKRRKPEKQQ
jgi:ribosome-associated toxin RatA of RatAB toxin-antitoxin module